MPDEAIQFSRSEQSAYSLRAAMRDELYPINVLGASSKRFAVPDAWKGKLVRFYADGGDLYYQVSTGTAATVDKTARAQESGSPIITLALPASGNGAAPIFSGTFADIAFPKNAQTFALQGSVDCCARAHLSET